MRSKISALRFAAVFCLALPRRIIRLVLPRWILRRVARRVETGDPAATLDRFFSSKHVKDLRAIIVISLAAVLIVLVVGFLLSLENEVHKLFAPGDNAANAASGAAAMEGTAASTSPAATSASTDAAWWQFPCHFAIAALHFPFATLANFLTFFGPVLGVFGGVVAWAYQTGSSRLGVVDLFACEISTLCRVTTVLDTVTMMINRRDGGSVAADAAPSATPGVNGETDASPAARAMQAKKFESQEQYFPVFENNTKDLQSLEARVVVNITAFYTYMKTVRDSMRGRAAAQEVIFLLYLALESGRKAIEDLVEFEPEQAERIITVLISELKAYGFLREKFNRTDDLRYGRLKLREPEYRKLIFRLTEIVRAGKRGPNSDQWEPAALLVSEVRKRHADALAAAARAAPIGPREVPSIADNLPAPAAA
jgi:hypothetical protein